jgi:hypothetical protein
MIITHKATFLLLMVLSTGSMLGRWYSTGAVAKPTEEAVPQELIDNLDSLEKRITETKIMTEAPIGRITLRYLLKNMKHYQDLAAQRYGNTLPASLSSKFNKIKKQLDAIEETFAGTRTGNDLTGLSEFFRARGRNEISPDEFTSFYTTKKSSGEFTKIGPEAENLIEHFFTTFKDQPIALTRSIAKNLFEILQATAINLPHSPKELIDEISAKNGELHSTMANFIHHFFTFLTSPTLDAAIGKANVPNVTAALKSGTRPSENQIKRAQKLSTKAQEEVDRYQMIVNLLNS